MTKRHFKAIAEVIALLDNPDDRQLVAQLIADALAPFNDRFDRKRFLKACGVEV